MVGRSRMVAVHGALAAVVALLLAPGSAAGQGKTPLGGTVTITGSQGRDDLTISARESESGATTNPFVVEPAATITATSGSCPPDLDPLTGRPVRNDCPISKSGPGITLVIDLRGGDDVLGIQADQGSPVASVTVTGNLGNDAIEVAATAPRTLRGGDGDDELRAPGRTGGQPVSFEGGGGRDLAGWGDVFAPQFSQGPDEGESGVTASLATNQATLTTRNSAGALVVVRTDPLSGIERLEGTQVGDILTGAAGPDELIGGDGPDDLRGGDGADVLGGGDGLDDLQGGKDADTLDGGPGADTYPKGLGNDTFLTRDGFAESVGCVKLDIVVNDLVDKVETPENCASISTAQAKHRFDTVLPGKPLRVGGDRTLRIPVRCPAPKPDRCEGTLAARLDKAPNRRSKRAPKALGGADYALRPGRRAVLELPLTHNEARQTRGKPVSLEADEVDGDGRARKIVRRVRVRRPE